VQYCVNGSQSAVGSQMMARERLMNNRTFININAELPAAGCRLPTEKGVILIAMLWILTALSIIALSFSRDSFVEVAAARNTQSMESSYFVARAGIQSAIYRILQKRFIRSVRRLEDRDTPDPVDLGRMSGDFGGGFYRVDIQDESGKISVNRVHEEQLRLLMEAAGIDKRDADIITDSILDWRDADSAHHLNGAEDDYYQSLDPPYQAKNGDLDTIEELLLVRGVTAEYFYGHPERDRDGSIVYKYGLSRYLTVYSPRNHINVNYAPLAVLLSIPGMPPEAARMIYDKRLTQPFKSREDISRGIPVPIGAEALSQISVEQTGIYTLTAAAHMENSKARRVIRTVVGLRLGQYPPYQILYWNENVPYYESMTP
jgi:general secretion pathway protein K